MLDRESTFKDPEIVKMLQEEFIPVALDQWYERRQQDAKGQFYRKIAAQGPRNDFEHTTQGHYVCDATGKLFGFNGNHADFSNVKKLMQKTVEDFDAASYENVKPIERGTPDLRFDLKPPTDGLIIRVYSKILGGYEKTENEYDVAFQKSIGQDNLWIQADEKTALIKAVKENGEVPAAIVRRLARFHLFDNTRGEPPRWTTEEIESMNLKVTDGIINGSAKLKTADGTRGYEAKLYGRIELDGDKLTRFDLVADGMHWGQGQHTGRGPKNKFPLAVTFRLVDGTELEHQAVPFGAKGWIDGYYESVE